jgi:hypothetical protein
MVVLVSTTNAVSQERKGMSLHWVVAGERDVVNDRAVAVGLLELRAALAEFGSELSDRGRTPEDANAVVLEIAPPSLELPETSSAQEEQFLIESSYKVATQAGAQRTITVSAASPPGLAYGLCHVAERIRVLKVVPDINETSVPVLPYRFIIAGPQVANTFTGPEVTEEALAASERAFEALAAKTVKNGYNFLIIHNTEDYIPWGEPHYQERSERYRKHLQRFISVAHAYHLRLLLIGDEFIYLPEYLKRLRATPSVKDDALWEALRSKYRDLLTLCPELDGIATRVGELIPKYDFRGLDLIHSPEPEPNPRIEERYRRFIKAMHEVVAGEFGKFYLHRTWAINVHEQHSIPQVYAGTFTEEVSAENLFLTIKLTAGDQWYHYEPYNETFGLTPHTTIAQGELYSGYQGGGMYIDYPARYFQAALEWAVDRKTKGILNGFGPECLPAEAILHVFSRLAWEPRADVVELTEDWAAATFGREVREDIAEIFLLASVAVRDGIYLRQPGLSNWAPIRQIRTNMFVQEGNPLWDKGKGHDAFLKDLYLECKPWFAETIAEMDHGLEISERMWGIFERCRNKIEDSEKAAALEQLLLHGHAAIRLNRDYVEAFLRYFRYREAPGDENKDQLASALERLKTSAEAYERDFEYYRLLGVHTFTDLAERALANLDEAERVLREAPTRQQVLDVYAEAQSESVRVLLENPNAVLFATWEGTIDGKDLLFIEDGRFRIEHIAHDPISSASLAVHNELPKDRPYRVIVKPIQVRGTVLVYEQPTPQNDGRIALYLEDLSSGQTVFRFELYAVYE